MADGRTFSEMMGRGLGNPGPPVAGVRATPNFGPAPNSEALGAKTGAPPHSQFYSRPISPANGGPPTLIVAGSPENRVAILIAPLVGWTIYIGNAGVTPQNGLALTGGLAYEAILPGLQELFAVTDAPVFLPLQIQVAPILFAERERKL